MNNAYIYKYSCKHISLVYMEIWLTHAILSSTGPDEDQQTYMLSIYQLSYGTLLWFVLFMSIFSSDGAMAYVNPLRAKYFKGNINIYLHFVSLLHIDMTQVLKTLPRVRPGPT